nr:unnamed protein product [Spirometra erinaceieuropaei]
MKDALVIFSVISALVIFTQQQEGTSNGFEDNVVTSTNTCITAVSHLPEKLTNIGVDLRRFTCSEGHCRPVRDDYLNFEYQQKKDGKNYWTEVKFCRYDNIFRIGLEVEGFQVAGRITRITQFLVPNGNWSINRNSCIQPQYSTPLIRNVTEGSEVEIQCAISKKICRYSENVVIFDLNTVFCEYNWNKRTCERREMDDTVIFVTKISNTEPNKYYPDQLQWNPDLSPMTTEKISTNEKTDSEELPQTLGAESTDRLYRSDGVCGL